MIRVGTHSGAGFGWSLWDNIERAFGCDYALESSLIEEAAVAYRIRHGVTLPERLKQILVNEKKVCTQQAMIAEVDRYGPPHPGDVASIDAATYEAEQQATGGATPPPGGLPPGGLPDAGGTPTWVWPVAIGVPVVLLLGIGAAVALKRKRK